MGRTGDAGKRRSALFLSMCVFVSCAAGQGDGRVTSARLFAEECLNEPFDLRPDFFAVNPAENTQMIRIQRGDKLPESSDGLLIVVRDVDRIRGDDGGAGLLGQPLPLRMPEGVAAPGALIAPTDEPALVSMTMYLNDSCFDEDISLQALQGTITFTRLFSGKINESDKSERLVEATFSATFADPRSLSPTVSEVSDQNPDLLSEVSGDFSFYYRRGQPAQPFP